MSAEKGNNYSSKGNRMWGNTLKRIATQNPEKMRKIGEKLFKMAEKGDIAAMKEIGDRVEGKAVSVVQAHVSKHEAALDELDYDETEESQDSEED